MDGRLHFYKGELVDTPPDQRADVVAMETMFERLGLTLEDVVSSSGDLADEYVMCDYTGDESRLRIAVKENPPVPSEAAENEARVLFTGSFALSALIAAALVALLAVLW